MKGDITKVGRLELAILREKGYSRRAIAKVLGRSPTISYEVRVNSVNGIYDPHKANIKAHVRKKGRRFQYSKIEKDPRLKEMIIEKLGEHWNPREIALWIHRHHTEWTVSTATIYTWLRTSRGDRYCDLLYSGRHRVKRHKPKTKRALIPHRVGIEDRPQAVSDRSVYGHYESDTIVSKKGGTGALLVLQERQSRCVYLWKLQGMKPRPCATYLKQASLMLGIQSITFDNGIENVYHEQIGIPTYFCDPYSSWQKGGIENVNKMIRRYLPKGTDLATVSQEFLDFIADRINKKPRVKLGGSSAFEMDAIGRGVLLGGRVS